MNKSNIFKSSQFFMNEGDTLHLLFIDETGTQVTIELIGNGEEDNAPGTPVATAATDIVDVSFTANWVGIENASKYYLDVSTDPMFDNTDPSDPLVLEDHDAGTAISHSVTGLSQSTTYYYRIRAYNENGLSAYSNTITLTTIPIDALVDLDGNIYTTVIIGGQEWTVENFRTTKYADGTAIPLITAMPTSENQLTGWTNGHGAYLYDTFTSVGADITSAISDTYAYTKSNTLSLVAGDTLRYDINLTLNSGSLPEVVLFKDGTPTQFVSLLNGVNTGGFTIMVDGVYGLGIYSGISGTNFSAVCEMTSDYTLSGGWISDTAGAYCWYNNIDPNDPSDVSLLVYGALYNQYAVNNVKGLAYLERGGIPESGWRVPSASDWEELKTYIGGDAIAGGVLKETGLTHWANPNTGATNDYGFTLLPAGERSNVDGTFSQITQLASLWSTDELYGYIIAYNDSSMLLNISDQNLGLSVRLVRDIDISSIIPTADDTTITADDTTLTADME